MFPLTFLKKCSHMGIACMVIFSLIIHSLFAGEAHLLSKQQPEQRKGAFCLTQQSYKEESEAVSEPQSFIRKLTSYVSSKASALRNPWGANDLLVDLRKLTYSTEDFQDDMESIVTSGDYSIAKYLQLRLEKLQEHVWKGEISPYVYYQGLIELEPYVGKADLCMIRKEFERKVTSFQPFVDNNFQRDLLNALEEIKDTSSLVGFEELLSYYGTLENSFDYGTTLTQFGEWVVRNGQLREDHLKALYSMIVQNLGQIDRKKYKKIESERSSIKRVLEELPFYNESLPKGFNSSLPSKAQPANNTKQSNSLGSVLKGLAYTLYKGTRYAVSHPKQVLALGLVAHILPTAAQTSNEFIINQNTTLTQDNPSVSVLTNGNVFVVWQDYRAGNWNSYGRVLFPNGTALRNEFIINQITTSAQSNPSVSGLANGNVFVAWEDFRGSTSDIYGRVFFPNGTALVSDFIINQVTTNTQTNPSVSGLTNGNVLVAWEDYRASSANAEIYGRVFLPSGTALGGGEFVINQITTNTQSNPSVSGLTNGNVIVVWDDRRAGLNDPDIYGRVFLPSGTALGGEFIINQITNNLQYGPAVSGLTNGNVLVAWGDYRSGDSDVYGRAFFPNGTALGNEFIINQITTYSQAGPSVSDLSDGNMFVAWQSDLGNNIYGRTFFPNGTALGSEFIINQNIPIAHYYPSVSGLANGTVFVAWQDDRAGTPDIYGRVFSYLDLAVESAASSLTSTPSSTSVVTQTSQITSSTTVTSLASNLPSPAPSPSVGSALQSSQMTSSDTISTLDTGSLGFTDTLPSSVPLPSTLSSAFASSSVTSITDSLEPSASSSFSSGTPWQTPTAIAGALGGVAIIGGVAVVVGKKKCSKQETATADSDIELSEETIETPSQIIDEKSHSTSRSSRRPSFLTPTPIGYTKHPTIIGKRYGRTYEIWNKLSQNEADRLRPLTSIVIPSSTAKKIKFTLGKGHFGVTYAGYNPQTKEIVAIKEVHGRSAVDESLREGEIVHSLGDYPHIMPMIDYINFEPSEQNEEPRLLQVMPLAYINGTGFKELLTHSSSTDRERLVSDSLWQMMMGLDYIHKKGVVHLDIKADNTLYMKDGTLRIADFGRAQQVGNNDHITDMNSLGDMRKFSPEIVAFIRKCIGGTFDTVEWFSGKGADVWAAGLYGWELLEDNTDNLFSTQRVPLRQRTATFTNKFFEESVEKINVTTQHPPKIILQKKLIF